MHVHGYKKRTRIVFNLQYLFNFEHKKTKQIANALHHRSQKYLTCYIYIYIVIRIEWNRHRHFLVSFNFFFTLPIVSENMNWIYIYCDLITISMVRWVFRSRWNCQDCVDATRRDDKMKNILYEQIYVRNRLKTLHQFVDR